METSRVAFAGLLLWLLTEVGVASDSAPDAVATPLPVVTYDPAPYQLIAGQNDLEKPWRRPPEVRYALLSGCGAGSDGSVNEPPTGGAFIGPPAKGGGAAPLTTVLVGPLVADTYTVRLGRGRSTPTIFEGNDLTIKLPGGPGAVVESDASSDPGGEASVFGPGAAETKRNGSRNGTDAETECAGGGGGFQFDPNEKRIGGRGGPGRLLIYPLPDLQRLFTLLTLLEESLPASAGSAVPAAGIPGENETRPGSPSEPQR